MKKRNVTIVINEDLYLKARVWAAHRGVSLSTVVRTVLENACTNPVAARRLPIRGETPAAPPAPASPQ
jgi:antitoxin component of RelBE/YafQ-DinJ toxin-antitoxin module